MFYYIRMLIFPCALVISGIACAQGGSDTDIVKLRQEIDQLRQDYESRIRDLEQRVAAAEQQATRAENTVQSAPPAAPAAGAVVVLPIKIPLASTTPYQQRLYPAGIVFLAMTYSP